MAKLNGRNYKELICNKCSKFVVYFNNISGKTIFFFQCPRCGNLNEWTFVDWKTIKEEVIMNNEKGGEK